MRKIMYVNLIGVVAVLYNNLFLIVIRVFCFHFTETAASYWLLGLSSVALAGII